MDLVFGMAAGNGMDQGHDVMDNNYMGCMGGDGSADYYMAFSGLLWLGMHGVAPL